ncbi:MAG TPA: electron transfer flavoprotein-ubiquinone oxidoreductase, partial [Rhodospirillaceae bacterium]|nr:electron transfer flavoprotein-ubiquinone oxidoreductase [Rhodospirillaceae bacterium]
GDTAGFLNVPKIKGNHTAMKSGMLAAENLAGLLNAGKDYGQNCANYEEALKKSWVYAELKKVRNIRPGFHWGLWAGLINAAFETLTNGLAPWTLKNHADHSSLKKANKCSKIEYPKPDNTVTFDKLTSVSLSATNHAEGQPCHLRLKNPKIPIEINLKQYDEPAQRYCPAGVYEIVNDDAGQLKLQINSQNCVHCKTCDIKDPSQNIDWATPQGGDGPNYPNM